MSILKRIFGTSKSGGAGSQKRQHSASPPEENQHKQAAESLRVRRDVLPSERSNSGANLNRWKASGEAEVWVWAHLERGKHQDWSDYLASLRKSQYWPMEEAAVGQHLEMLRAKLTAHLDAVLEKKALAALDYFAEKKMQPTQPRDAGAMLASQPKLPRRPW